MTDKITRTPDQRRAIRDSMKRIRENNAAFQSMTRLPPGEAPDVIFKAKIAEDRNFRSSRAISSNGITVNYMLNKREAVVSTSSTAFDTMGTKAETYAKTEKFKTRFEDLDAIESNSGEWKISDELRSELDSNGRVRIKLQMVSDLREPDSRMWEGVISDIISGDSGSMSPVRRTPGGMAFAYADVGPDTARKLCDCPAVLSMTTISTASIDVEDAGECEPVCFDLNDDVNVPSLRKTVVLDNGVDLPGGLSKLVVGRYTAPGLSDARGEHGTMVASKLAFGVIGTDTSAFDQMKPRCSIVDYKVIEKEEDPAVLAQRIREAVTLLHEDSDTFVFSVNVDRPSTMGDDELSVALDDLRSEYNVNFFVPTGNHDLWKTESDIESILLDSDSGLASPADAITAISVGAVVGETHKGSLSEKDWPAPYSRIGPGPLPVRKPNVVGVSGTVMGDKTFPMDPYSAVISPKGLTSHSGTSFSNPDVAGRFMAIRDVLGDSDGLTSLAMLHHFARNPEWSAKSNLLDRRNIFGYGIVDERVMDFDPRSYALLIRRSTIREGDNEVVTLSVPKSIADLIEDREDIRIKITCLNGAPVDRSKGMDMVRATIVINLKGIKEKNEETKDSFWDVCKQKSYRPSSLATNGWSFSIKAYGKEEMKKRPIPYALIVSFEDLSGTIDVSSEIRADGRYPILGSIDSRIGSDVRAKITGSIR